MPMHDYRKRNRWHLIWGQRVGRPECPYLRRWALETPWGSLRLHHWFGSDDHRAFHDHPWWFWTLVLRGGYTDVSPGFHPEETDQDPPATCRQRMTPGTLRFREAHHRHTVEVDPGGCWTVLLTGPHERYWGFWRPRRSDGKPVFVKSNRYFLEEGNHPCQGAPK